MSRHVVGALAAVDAKCCRVRSSCAATVVEEASQPTCMFSQHQDFLAADQPSFQCSKPASQLNGKELEAVALLPSSAAAVVDAGPVSLVSVVGSARLQHQQYSQGLSCPKNLYSKWSSTGPTLHHSMSWSPSYWWHRQDRFVGASAASASSPVVAAGASVVSASPLSFGALLSASSKAVVKVQGALWEPLHGKTGIELPQQPGPHFSQSGAPQRSPHAAAQQLTLSWWRTPPYCAQLSRTFSTTEISPGTSSTGGSLVLVPVADVSVRVIVVSVRVIVVSVRVTVDVSVGASVVEVVVVSSGSSSMACL
mmetsp:Transcript_8041/g.21469  ORF Transcript_8041/g.21469 Transcript_8041/m.21469 type:complete len:309 (-) Transcript_8041:1245-2171(-)